MASASASATDAAAGGGTVQPASYRVIGVLLAVGSGLLIGGSFIFKKKGLLASQQKYGGVKGEGHGYLKSWLVRSTFSFARRVCVRILIISG